MRNKPELLAPAKLGKVKTAMLWCGCGVFRGRQFGLCALNNLV